MNHYDAFPKRGQADDYDRRAYRREQTAILKETSGRDYFTLAVALTQEHAREVNVEKNRLREHAARNGWTADDAVRVFQSGEFDLDKDTIYDVLRPFGRED